MKPIFILLFSIIIQINISNVNGQSSTKTKTFPQKQLDEKIELSTVDLSSTPGCTGIPGEPLSSSLDDSKLLSLLAGVQPLNILGSQKHLRWTPNKKRRSVNRKHHK